MNRPQPPKWINSILDWYCKEEYANEIRGDLLELYDRWLEKGKFRANMKYVLHALLFMRIYNSKVFSIHHQSQLGMFKSHFKIGFRHLLSNKWYALINIGGLAIGMAVCILIYQYVTHEQSFDNFHKNHENTYRLEQVYTRAGALLDHQGYSTYGLGPAAQETIPELLQYTRLHPQEVSYVVENTEDGKVFFEDQMWYADDNFSSTFNFPLLHGDPQLILSDPKNIVLTEEMSIKYFGVSNSVGKVLKVSAGTLSGNFTIAGVFEKLPENTHLKFDFLMPMSFLLEHWRPYRELDNGWVWPNFVTYATFKSQANLSRMDQKFEQIITAHADDLELGRDQLELSINLLPIRDIHLKSGCHTELTNNKGDSEQIRIIILIGIFLLIIASVNYINLTTAHAMIRNKEVGIRKSIGAFQSQLIGQFLIESFLINLFAGLCSVLLAMTLMPVLNELIEKELLLTLVYEWEFWIQFIVVIVLSSLVSGCYPAFLISSFDPFTLLKAKGLGSKKNYVRKGLIAFQFVASLFLIAATYLVYDQINFMKNKDLGVDMEKILVVSGPRVILSLDKSERKIKRQTFKDELSKYHAIHGVSVIGAVPCLGYNWTGSVWRYGDLSATSQDVHAFYVDSNFPNVFDLEFIAGKKFSEGNHDAPNEGVVVNEEALKVFGLGTPKEALYEKLVFPTDTLTITGVVKDVFWNSPKYHHTPYVFIQEAYEAYYAVKVNLSNAQETIDHIEASFIGAFPNDPFEYFFLDEAFNSQYKADIRFGKLLSAFTCLAVVIACLGLYGLISFSANLKIKEIGIRKILGARISDLILLLFTEYFQLLVIATCLVIPVIYFWANSWLENFAFRTRLGIDLFLLPSVILLVISILTVSYRIYVTAQANPVNSLKDE